MFNRILKADSSVDEVKHDIHEWTEAESKSAQRQGDESEYIACGKQI